ncbi:hypothetical protein SSPSH_003389 [Salinisphaera shabanensis E1L3A]|uniref:Uncharacterized protein n=1 Tax=Salinisphaera shabanensis E1L3A TaxID=1033802 RepID=U2EHD5_9GAMM|nr:hypothetical protein SSPSH_003389 [Salinisphaera shabanensis E1L3A]
MRCGLFAIYQAGKQVLRRAESAGGTVPRSNFRLWIRSAGSADSAFSDSEICFYRMSERWLHGSGRRKPILFHAVPAIAPNTAPIAWIPFANICSNSPPSSGTMKYKSTTPESKVSGKPIEKIDS